ncbi:MAG: tRNA-(ms[2]io[6]A)-hydroxylase [Sphingobacteriales bacterium]|nr:tRNA-(ms[2]io[6]A)-hydroxylase [Sphingobacteriales bacterium]
MDKINIKNKQVLGLQLPTDPRWVNLAAMQLEDILTDHAYCEQKAASTCISIIQRFSEYAPVVEALAPIVTEEWGHFRAVLHELKNRGLKLGKQRRDEYVIALFDFVRGGSTRDEQLVEQLLLCALIEARSCERFRLLSEQLEDEHLQRFYRIFMESEAGHYRLFLELAKNYMPEEKVWQRWREWLAFEKDLMSRLTPRADRMH